MLISSPVKIGRNDPCPCGSGKKYKKCCLGKQTAPDDSPAARVYEAQDRLLGELMDFLTDRFQGYFVDAWADYHFASAEDVPAPDDDHQMIFMPYSLFHWDPESPGDTCTNLVEGGMIARTFLKECSHRLGEMERQILKTLMRQPFNYYEVITCPPDEDFLVRDLWTDQETTVSKLSGSENMLVGDILYAQMLPMEEVTIMSFAAPLVIPGEMKPPILEYREILRESLEDGARDFSINDVREQQDDLRELYFEILDALNMPENVENTDGEPFELHTITYQVESAQAAFDALSTLAKGVPKQDLLRYAEYDADGRLTKIEFPWAKKGNRKFKDWNDTVLGSIQLSGRTLVAEVNSENRAKQLKKEIEKRLGAAAVHKGTVRKSYEEVLETQPEKLVPPEKNSDVIEDVLHEPELQDALRDLLQQEVNSWPHQKVPALDDKTPLQAITEPEGRKAVESLVASYEQSLERNFPPSIRPDLSFVRKLLSL